MAKPICSICGVEIDKEKRFGMRFFEKNVKEVNDVLNERLKKFHAKGIYPGEIDYSDIKEWIESRIETYACEECCPKKSTNLIWKK